MTIRGLVTEQVGAEKRSRIAVIAEESLGEGNVTVGVEWSTINYKDGLALHRSGVMKTLPLVGGIDFAGLVEASDDPAYHPGDRVLVNGWDLSQTHNGGYAQKARVPGEWLVPVPDAFTTRQAMAIGTAGYTAMLCVLALEQHGITAEKGEVLVTGAAGGVGSIAIALLSKLGYRVVASTGRSEEEPFLRELGAHRVIDRGQLSTPGSPIGKELWAGAIDTVGSHTLANVLAHVAYRGTVAVCGMAQGLDLPGSVAPFILRNVTLAGIDSVRAPREVRLEAWSRLSSDLDPEKLESTITEIPLQQVPEVSSRILEGKVRGRTLVNVGDSF